MGKAWTRAFIVTVAERGEAGKQLSRLRLGSFDKGWQAQGKGAGAKLCCLWPFSCCCFLVAKSCPTLWPRVRQPAKLLCPWDSPGKNGGGAVTSLGFRPFIKAKVTAGHSTRFTDLFYLPLPCGMGWSKQFF